MPRFSKQALVQCIRIRRMNLESTYRHQAGRHIDPSNGTAQLPRGNVAAAVTYGEWYALGALLASVSAGEVVA
jgi:hypothetical protein